MELLPTIDALHWIADAGPEILADEKVPMPQLFLKTKRAALHLRAARRGRRDRAVELPVAHPARRGRAGADGGQRRRAQAGVATPLIGERIARVFERAGLPGGLVRVVHGPGTGAGARRSRPSAKVLFTGSARGRARGRRGVRAAAEGLGARARAARTR